MKGRRGFSLIEVVTVIVIVGIVSLLGRQTYLAVKKSADELSTRTAISAIYVDSRRIVAETAATTNIPEFPVDLVSEIIVSGIVVSSGNSNNPEDVSVSRVDSVTAIYASFGGGNCTVFVDRLVGKSGWGSDKDALTCNALSYIERLNEISGSFESPNEL